MTLLKLNFDQDFNKFIKIVAWALKMKQCQTLKIPSYRPNLLSLYRSITIVCPSYNKIFMDLWTCERESNIHFLTQSIPSFWSGLFYLPFLHVPWESIQGLLSVIYNFIFGSNLYSLSVLPLYLRTNSVPCLVLSAWYFCCLPIRCLVHWEHGLVSLTFLYARKDRGSVL